MSVCILCFGSGEPQIQALANTDKADEFKNLQKISYYLRDYQLLNVFILRRRLKLAKADR